MAKVASDLDHPDYQGATNPDSRLAVMFFKQATENAFESEAQGRPIFYDVDMVRIQVPGDTTTVIVAPVREDHKKRFPLQWAHFMNMHGGDPREIGTPLSQWPRLGQSQVEELKALKFFTVESIATAADQQLQRINMIAGMSPYAFRDHAIRFLKIAQDDSTTQAAEDRAKALEEENKKLREETDAKLAEMAAQIAALSLPKEKRAYKKRKDVTA